MDFLSPIRKARILVRVLVFLCVELVWSNSIIEEVKRAKVCLINDIVVRLK